MLDVADRNLARENETYERKKLVPGPLPRLLIT